jgi:putative NIF3 family GTP cyclohydrolase 1 type 2
VTFTLTSFSNIKHDSQVITPVTTVPEIYDAGYGRIVRFEEPQILGEILVRIMKKMPGIEEKYHLNVAIPQSTPLEDRFKIPISSIGICAGSGGSVLNGVDVDMLFAGELAHHEALAAIEQGRVVVTTYHSNSERGYLHLRMRFLLDRAIEDVVLSEDPRFSGFDRKDGYSVAVSKADRDPFIPMTGRVT